MNTIVGIWFLIVGVIALARPDFLHKKELLSAEKIERNRRIFRVMGIGLTICGIGILVLQFFK